MSSGAGVAPPPIETPPAPRSKKARLSVEDASKFVLSGYINKDTTVAEAGSAGVAAKVSKNPLGLMRRSRGLSASFVA